MEESGAAVGKRYSVWSCSLIIQGLGNSIFEQNNIGIGTATSTTNWCVQIDGAQMMDALRTGMMMMVLIWRKLSSERDDGKSRTYFYFFAFTRVFKKEAVSFLDR